MGGSCRSCCLKACLQSASQNRLNVWQPIYLKSPGSLITTCFCVCFSFRGHPIVSFRFPFKPHPNKRVPRLPADGQDRDEDTDTVPLGFTLHVSRRGGAENRFVGSILGARLNWDRKAQNVENKGHLKVAVFCWFPLWCPLETWSKRVPYGEKQPYIHICIHIYIYYIYI